MLQLLLFLASPCMAVFLFLNKTNWEDLDNIFQKSELELK